MVILLQYKMVVPTTSSSIKIAFTAIQGSNPIAGFQCSLDNSPFSSCSSPAAVNNLVRDHISS